jgi:pimeloyl-ACP methyl ester carboxylesterase
VYRDAYTRVRNGVLRPGPDPTYADGDDATWMDVDWPALTRRLEVDGRGVNVIDGGGNGPPLLFLHGLGGLWQNWLLNLPAFMDTHRVVAIDLPGFGGSEMPAGDISIPNFARAVDAVCRELGLEEPVVVGNSMGGFVGAEVAVSFPTRVSKLVLLSAAGLSTEYLMREPLLAAARTWAVMTARTGVRADVAVMRPRLRRAALQVVVRYPERLSVPLSLELVRGANAPGFIPAFDALMRHSYRESLERIAIPVLIVWGRNDILVPVEDAEMYEHLIGENAHSVIFEDTGHLPMVERPSRFNELLAAFMAGERAPERGVEGVSG